MKEPLLDIEDAGEAADQATTECLLRCWVRETGISAPPTGTPLRLELKALETVVNIPVRYWSRAGLHRFGRPYLPTGVPLDCTSLSVMLCLELGLSHDVPPEAVSDVASRVIDSARRSAHHIRVRRAEPIDPPGTSLFLAAEQALLLGHPWHPAPKSREGLSADEAARFSPELRGSFALCWFAASREIVFSDSAMTESAETLVAELAGELAVPSGYLAVPTHPRQARDLLSRPGIQRLIDEQALHPLGPSGPLWSPTSSLRTVHRSDAPVMLKLSLGLHITNYRREQSRAELCRGLAVHRILEAGLADELHAVHPCFGIVRDPAWLAVGNPHAAGDTGLEVVLRDNTFIQDQRVACLAGLTSERPDLPDGCSLLSTIVYRIADRTGRSTADISGEWFGRYLRVVIAPMLWLYTTWGLALEAHQQNTLVVLDENGWPVGGRHRDNQGYYFSEARIGKLFRLSPEAGQDLDLVCPDAVLEDLLAYFIGVNNVLGLVGAFGGQHLAGEHELLLRAREEFAAMVPEPTTGRSFVERLLDAPTLHCKANMLTRIAGLGALVGPLETRSLYVDIPNPFAQVRQ